ncbi:hypothetical protein V8B97DRAFT_1323082 [Scleroderma yunnanense]
MFLIPDADISSCDFESPTSTSRSYDMVVSQGFLMAAWHVRVLVVILGSSLVHMRCHRRLMVPYERYESLVGDLDDTVSRASSTQQVDAAAACCTVVVTVSPPVLLSTSLVWSPSLSIFSHALSTRLKTIILFALPESSTCAVHDTNTSTLTCFHALATVNFTSSVLSVMCSDIFGYVFSWSYIVRHAWCVHAPAGRIRMDSDAIYIACVSSHRYSILR